MSILLFTENFIDQDVISNSYVSSEQASFPAENVYNKQRRSKVWRSNGYFEIISGENTIVFNEGGGDLTATITAGEYSSASALATALETALDAQATADITVTYTATFKFQIASNGATFNIKWTHANSLDMAAVLGFDDSVDDTGLLSYLADELRIHTSEWLKWDMGISSNPTSFILTGPRNRPIKISPTATLKLQGNPTDNWSAPEYESTLTYDDELIFKHDANGLHTNALRYWRLLIIDQNPLGYVEIGAAYLGGYYSPTYGKVQFPFSSQYIDRSDTIYSEGGQTFSDVREKSQGYNITWFNLKKDEIEDITEIFEEFGTSVPMFVSFDQNEVFSTLKNRRIKYVKLKNEPRYQLVRPNVFDMSMQFEEQL